VLRWRFKRYIHAGAIKFPLEEQNIRPTRIAGTSAGAIVGAMYSWERVLMNFRFFFKSYLFSVEYFTFKESILVDSESFRLYFQAIFEDALIGEN
jgi:NTE family protein